MSCIASSDNLLKVRQFGKWWESCVPELLLKCELFKEREINL